MQCLKNNVAVLLTHMHFLSNVFSLCVIDRSQSITVSVKTTLDRAEKGDIPSVYIESTEATPLAVSRGIHAVN